MINRFFWNLLSLAFPWLVLLIHDNPGGALVALVMQASLIGWIPASAWAMRTAREAQQQQKSRARAEQPGKQ